MKKNKYRENFSSNEFLCHCGCGECEVSDKLLDALQMLRDILGKPIKVMSGRRCKTHNSACGGARRSQHLLGNAADIQVTGMTPDKLLAWVKIVPAFKGIGIYHPGRRYGIGWVHVDVRDRRARWTKK